MPRLSIRLNILIQVSFHFISAYSVYSNSFDCSTFYTGEFHYILNGVETKAIRRNGYQEIFKKVNGKFIKDSVESILWLDECSFKIKIIQSITPVPNWVLSQGLVIKIISVEGNSYIYQAYLDRTQYYSGKVTKLK